MSAQRGTIRVASSRAAAPVYGSSEATRTTPSPVRQSPPTDIHETPEGLILEADLAGASDKDVVIRLEDNILTLEARVERPVPEGARPLYQESRAVELARSFILSNEVERSRITAELKNGVLRLTLPRAARPRARRVEVKSQ